MNDFTFQNTTKVYFGRCALDHLAKETKALGTKALLVYGGGSVKRTGTYDKVAGPLHEAGIQTFDLGGVEPNPRHTTVNRGAAICRKEGVEVVIAIGGGSSIDCAKGVAALALTEGTDDVWDLVEGKVAYPKALPIIAVVTLAATGSEMDAGAVISNIETGEKRGIGGPCVRPRVAFENPELTFTVPAYQTAAGSFDIMCHVFDTRYFTLQDQMEMLHGMQEELLRTVVKFAPIAIAEPDNYEARANLMWASSWALNSFLTSGVRMQTVLHAIEHELSAQYDITHGHGLAILAPRWMEYVLSDETAPVFARFGTHVMGVEEAGDDMATAKAAIDALATFCFETLGLSSHLADLGIDDSKFALMAQAATHGDVIHGMTDLDAADVEAIYRMCL